MVERLFLAVPRGCLRFVIVVFPDHTHLLFLLRKCKYESITDAYHRTVFTLGTAPRTTIVRPKQRMDIS